MIQTTLTKLPTVKAKTLKVDVTRALYGPLSDALREAGYNFDVKASKSKTTFVIHTGWKK